MEVPGTVERLRGDGAYRLEGALVSLAVAVALFTRFGIKGELSRDEAIYTYGGQRLAHGVAPYASIFDPKAPLATLVAGVAAGVARLLGRNDIYFIRLAFFVCACLTVLAVYLLAARLWRSALAGVVAAVVFASFNGFAADALSGPDAKTPGVLFAVLSMWLILRRRWFWAAFAGSLALLDWQPLVVYLLVVAVAAVVMSPADQRWRALGVSAVGGAVPLAAVGIYFAAAGAFGKLVEATVVFPATGVIRTDETVGDRLQRIVDVVHESYRFSGVLFWVGLALLLLLVAAHVVRRRRHPLSVVRDPLVLVVFVTLLAEAAYVTTDFQGYPDVFPLLPYPALGLGGAAAVVVVALRRSVSVRRAATAGLLAAAVLLAAFSWTWFSDAAAKDHAFRAEQADTCAVQRMLGPRGRLYAIGDPTSLVMTHRRNPDRFIYLGSGIGHWKVEHTPGGFAGWTAQIRAAAPSVVVMATWHTALSRALARWLERSGYSSAFAGVWRVFASPPARDRARATGVRLTKRPTPFATGPTGHRLPVEGCG